MPDINATMKNSLGAKIIPFPQKKKAQAVRKDDGAHTLACMCMYYTTLVVPGDQDLVKFFFGGGGLHKLADAIRESSCCSTKALREFADNL